MKFICGIHRKGSPECKEEFTDLYELLCHINNAHVHKTMNDSRQDHAAGDEREGGRTWDMRL